MEKNQTKLDFKVLASIGDLVNVLGVRESSEWSATISDCYDFLGAQDRLWPAKGAAAILDMLHHPVETLELLPDEVPDAGVVWNVLLGPVKQDIPGLWSSDRDVVDVWNGGVWNLGL